MRASQESAAPWHRMYMGDRQHFQNRCKDIPFGAAAAASGKAPQTGFELKFDNTLVDLREEGPNLCH
jgi:hypothetical protein